MSSLYLFFFIAILVRVHANNYEIQKLTIDFFERKFIRQVTVFACWDNHEQVNFYHHSTVSKLKLTYIPIPSDALDMRRLLTVNYYTLGIILNLDCRYSDSVLSEFSRQQLPYNQSYHWLLVTKLDTPPITMLHDLPLTIDTEMSVAVKSGLDYILYDVYNPSYRHGGILNVTYMGKWNQYSGLDIKLTQYKYQRRANLEGLSINVSLVLLHEPTPDVTTYMTNPINRHLDTMHRYNYALIRNLQDYYNFTIHLKLTNSWGYLINGSYNGMVGDLIAGIADIGGSPIMFKNERLKVSEFTVQTYMAKGCFIFRHPKKRTVHNGFLKPFKKEVWYFTIIMAVLSWILLWLTARVEIHFRDHPPLNTLYSHTGSETALITLAAACQQGLSGGPQLYSGRLVFLSLFLWTLLLYQYYSASIVGSLLAEPPRYIKTLQDLLDSDMPVGLEDIAYTRNHFATTTDPIALELYRRKVAPGKGRKYAAYFNVTEGLRRVQKGNFAYHTDVDSAYKFITDEFTEDEICDLVEITLFPAPHLGTVTSKHSPFKKMVTYGLRQIIEHGIGERIKHVWRYRQPLCPASYKLKPVQIPVEEFIPALFLLLFGAIGAATVFFIEYFVKQGIPCSWIIG
ncbi:ionotropic receptor 75a-like isoform X1 [Neodiprion virginianus]|uniref:ionotropic receptor 75a-like isoform X1 n=1 Tax=Neodiprion virginianus TaxID=2961670 RepID=UPI001EE711F0|nr:ionotropic receptor 75a-like isoform X1 [Neodiprion virginianus]